MPFHLTHSQATYFRSQKMIQLDRYRLSDTAPSIESTAFLTTLSPSTSDTQPTIKTSDTDGVAKAREGKDTGERGAHLLELRRLAWLHRRIFSNWNYPVTESIRDTERPK